VETGGDLPEEKKEMTEGTKVKAVKVMNISSKVGTKTGVVVGIEEWEPVWTKLQKAQSSWLSKAPW